MQLDPSRLLSRNCRGARSCLIGVEAAVRAGEGFKVNGISPAAAASCQVRVRAAFERAGFPFPGGRVLVTLDGPVRDAERHYDLPIALTILHAARLIPDTAFSDWTRQEFFGEFNAQGELADCDALLPTISAASSSRHCLFVPANNWRPFTLLGRVRLAPVPSLRAAVEHLSGAQPLAVSRAPVPALPPPVSVLTLLTWPISELAREGIIAAVAGGHGLLLIGADTELRAAAPAMLRELMPRPTVPEAQSVLLNHAAAGARLAAERWGERPILAPSKTLRERREEHGRRNSLEEQCHEDLLCAQYGVLWLDELSEFEHAVLEALAGQIFCHAMYRKSLQLLMSMRSVGLAAAGAKWQDSLPRFARQQATVRVDLTQRTPPPVLTLQEQQALTAQYRARIQDAWEQQVRRGHRLNGQLLENEAGYYCRGTPECSAWLQRYLQTTPLDRDALRHLQRLALTVADLDRTHVSGQLLQLAHVQKALQLFGLPLPPAAIAGRRQDSGSDCAHRD